MTRAISLRVPELRANKFRLMMIISYKKNKEFNLKE